MSLLSRGYSPAGSADPTSFHPLFRFLSDFDQYNQASTSNSTNAPSHQHHILPTFRPKFDIKETANEYELHGELPGIEQKDVDIEFTDGQTLVIRGRTEQRYTKRSPSEAGNSIKNSAEQGKLGNDSHQPTVEDGDDEDTGVQSGAENANKNTGVAKRSKEASLQHQQQQPQARYLVSERSIGEFSRTFNFPTNVDSDAVTASMKNGILSVIVPKLKRSGGRKIQITS